MVGSIVYGMALVIIGLDIYLANLFVGGMNVRHIAEWYGLYLSIVGGAFIIWLLIDIQHYIGSIGKYKTSQSSGQMQLVIGEDGELCLEIPLEEEREKLPEYYGFTRGRHAGSFFLTRAGSLAALLSAILSFYLSVTLSVCPALPISSLYLPSCLTF